MTLSEAKTIRAEIVKTCPAGHKARNISKRVMQSLMNEREDIAMTILAGRFDHLAHDYDIDDRYAVQLERALRLAKGEE